VAQAVRALQCGDADMAVAGAASISFPNLGYMYGEGLVGSVDGRVRPFDASASGTVRCVFMHVMRGHVCDETTCM
jgi:acyl transferase domain-containing protein